MKILAFVESPDHVCCRYRISAFTEHWQQKGHDLTIQSWPRNAMTRLLGLAPRGSADVVILQRLLVNWLDLQNLRRVGRKLLFDFDDALWLRDSYSAKGFHSRKRAARFQRIVTHCDGVIAGNAVLAAEAAQWTDPDMVKIIPTCVNAEQYRPQPRAPGSPFTMVWIGSRSTLQGLEQSRDLWEAVGRALPRGSRLRVICDHFPRFEHLAVEQVPWSADTEADALATADVGIGWVPDDPWSRGKCGLKILQYMAAGLPVVANPVGVQAEMVRPGRTGFLATTREEWVTALTTLLQQQALREQYGLAGRADLEMRYSVSAGAQLWDTVLAKMNRATS
jgi:glycosyltransferase involved in cell wall biosynthesis